VGLLAAVGAGFLVADRYLAPLLAGTLLLTLLMAGLHLRRHRQPGPFVLSLFAAGSVFFAVYGVWTPWLAYGAIVVLLVAQVWDLRLYRRCTRTVTAVPSHAVSAA
jgi:hypothetical protein